MATRTTRKGGAGNAAPQGATPREDARTSAGKAIRDDTGKWSAGLANEAQAARLGRIAGLMPQIDQLAADLAGRMRGGAGTGYNTTFHAAGDVQRLAMLREAAAAPGLDSAIADYAAARVGWRAYVHGLWYTHENGRTFLAAPDGGDAATFLVAREVKPAELVAALARLDALGRALPKLGRGKRRPPTKEAPGPRVAVPGKERRIAPKREAGMRGRRVPRWAVPIPPREAEPGEG
jgi:hypothetical protein